MNLTSVNDLRNNQISTKKYNTNKSDGKAPSKKEYSKWLKPS